MEHGPGIGEICSDVSSETFRNFDRSGYMMSFIHRLKGHNRQHSGHPGRKQN